MDVIFEPETYWPAGLFLASKKERKDRYLKSQDAGLNPLLYPQVKSAHFWPREMKLFSVHSVNQKDL